MSRILFLDTETGLIDPLPGSVLELAFVVYDPGITEEEPQTFHARLKWPVYQVSAKALEINRINLVDHDKWGVTPVQFCKDLHKWVCEHVINVEQPKITLGGHNTHFDMRQLMFILNYAVDLECFEARDLRKVFLHRMVDTYPIAHALHESGKLKIEEMGYNGSIDLPCLTKALDITLEGTEVHHTAMGDILATIQVYKKLVDLMRS